jgi:hypothetical protein
MKRFLAISMLLAAFIANAQPPMPMASVVETNAAPEAQQAFMASLRWVPFNEPCIVTVSNVATNYSNTLGSGSSGTHPVWVGWGANSIRVSSFNLSATSTATLATSPYLQWWGRYQATTNLVHWQEATGTNQMLSGPFKQLRTVSWTTTNWK